MSTEEKPPPDLRWRRILASGFDLVFTTYIRACLAGLVIVFPLAVLVAFPLGLHPGDEPEAFRIGLVVLVSVLGAGSRDWVHELWTPPRVAAGLLNGKKLFRLRVIDLATGRPVTLAASLRRNLPLLLPPVWPVIVVQLLLGRERHLLDILAGTQVVDVQRK